MRACLRDQNEPEIVKALRQVGASVEFADLKPYDLIVGYRHLTYLLEIKTEHGKLQESQEDFKRTWRGHYAIVRNADEALIAIGAMNPIQLTEAAWPNKRSARK